MAYATNVNKRVDENVALFKERLVGRDRLAARHLFSSMSHLETIAVFAAERGYGVDEQLEDELVHRDTFARLAHKHGGLVPPAEKVQVLIDYLKTLTGEDSIAALNVVAESWLDTVFDAIAESGFASELFKSIEADEHRHVHEALTMTRPDPEAFTEVVRNLEKMLIDISFTAEFMLPLLWVMGQTNVSNMGLAICDAHERACEHMGIEPDLRDMRLSARALRLLHRTAPDPVDMNEWEKVKVETWKEPAPQFCYFTVQVDTKNPVKLQAMFVSAIGRVLMRYPRLRNVVRGEQLYRTDPPIIGVRALYDDERVMTLWVSRPHMKTWKDVVKVLSRQKRKIMDEPYDPYEGMVSLGSELIDLYPPHRSCCVVTYNGDFGGLYGTGPLSDLEGVPMIVTIGRPHKEFVDVDGSPVWKDVVNVCICADHRTVDGRDIGVMADEVTKELTR